MSDGINHIEAASWFTPVMTLVGTVFGGILLWAAQRLVGKAAWQQAITAANRDLIDQLQEERADARRSLENYKIESAAERAQLRGEIINLTQTVTTMKRWMRENGHDFPEDRYPPVALVLLSEEKK